MRATVGILLLVAACSSAPSGEGGRVEEMDAGRVGDASAPSTEAGRHDAGSKPTPEAGGADVVLLADAADDVADAGTSCSVDGEPGMCLNVSTCATMKDMISMAGYCPGPADIECCVRTPNVADNPPTPNGYMLMTQSAVTAAMTNWAVMILDDPTDYPLFSTAKKTFGTQPVLALVEWHPPDFNNSAVHRGVTLFVPI